MKYTTKSHFSREEKLAYIRVCRGQIHKAKPYFSKQASAAGVWAALSERSYGGIGFMRGNFVWYIKPRQMSEGTTKNAHTQAKRAFF